ncbi:MAG: hypothetical protein IJH07_03305 [Ruminococcus sp.]|nr:hypothetical protein [Ruminococcus sp.]
MCLIGFLAEYVTAVFMDIGVALISLPFAGMAALIGKHEDKQKVKLLKRHPQNNHLWIYKDELKPGIPVKQTGFSYTVYDADEHVRYTARSTQLDKRLTINLFDTDINRIAEISERRFKRKRFSGNTTILFTAYLAGKGKEELCYSSIRSRESLDYNNNEYSVHVKKNGWYTVTNIHTGKTSEILRMSSYTFLDFDDPSQEHILLTLAFALEAKSLAFEREHRKKVAKYGP